MVYHLNASSVRGPNGETFGGNDAEFALAAGAKVGHMTALFGQAQLNFPKEGAKAGGLRQPAVNPVTQGAHVTEYMRGVRPGPNAVLRTYYAERLGVRDVSVEQYGTVFGIRSGGAWKFYRQTRTRIGYRPRDAAAHVYQWFDPVCVRFWP